jgi:hypothetical protein
MVIMGKIVIAAIFILVGLSQAWADAPAVSWTKQFGGSEADYSYSVEVLSSNQYLIAGYGRIETYPNYNNGKIIILNQDGSVAGSWEYGADSTEDIIRTAKETSDGGFITAGYSNGTFGSEGSNYYLMKLNSGGGVEWTSDFNVVSVADYGSDVCQTLDGGYIMVGYSYYYSETLEDYDWGVGIVKSDAMGNELNSTLIDRYGTQHLYRVIPTSDSGAIAVGSAASIYLVKIDKYGDTTWVKGCGGVGTGWSVLEMEDGGYMAFGDRGFGYPNYDDFWMVRLNASGDTLWTKRYPHKADDIGYSIDRTSDGGFVMAGSAFRNDGQDPKDFYIIRTNANGDTLWTKMVGRDYGDYATCIKQTPDGGYIVVGWTEIGNGSTDIYVVKLEPDNSSDVNHDNNIYPSSFSLSANYPNPFNPNTTIGYGLQRRAHVTIDIFNLLGQKVKTLIDETKGAGQYSTEWNGRDESGQAVSSGIYFYRLEAGNEAQVNKMMLLK